MSQPEPAQTPKRHWTFGSAALATIGLMILVPSGLCTGIFGIFALSDVSSDSASFLMSALVFGGPFIVIGLGLTIVGFNLRRRD